MKIIQLGQCLFLLSYSMHFSGRWVIVLIVTMLAQVVSAQEPARQNSPAVSRTRDTHSISTREEQLAAEIKKCRNQISLLSKEILQLDKKMKELKLAAIEAEKDYNKWLLNYENSSVRRDNQTKSIRKNELQKKLKEIDHQLAFCKKEKINKQARIKELELLIAKLQEQKSE